MEYFLGHNGWDMISGKGCDFSHNFDWILTAGGLLKKKDIPKTIYIKIDYIEDFVKNVLPELKNPFILISACSDFSPEIIFKKEYDIIINNIFLIHWYMENMYKKHIKTSSLPVGLASHTIEDEKLLIDIRNNKNLKNKKDKIFCFWNNKNNNVCGREFDFRVKSKEFALQYREKFDVYENNVSLKDFLKILSEYRYSFCPNGNGIDPNPTAWYSLALNVTPIVYATENAIDMFKDINSVVFIKEPNEIFTKNLDLEPVDIEFLTSKYWSDKILNNQTR